MQKRMRRKYLGSGLANVLPYPNQTTASFFGHWLSTHNSLGEAMKLLELPHKKRSQALVEMVGDELVVNLEAEQKGLYDHTMTAYVMDKNKPEELELRLKWARIWDLNKLKNTLDTLWVQLGWIQNPKQVVVRADRLEAEVKGDLKFKTKSIDEINEVLGSLVWPRWLAIDYWLEFYCQMAVKQPTAKRLAFFTYVGHQILAKDWKYASYKDRFKIGLGKLTLESYWQKYGLRAENELELSYPRFYEIKKNINKQIRQSRPLIPSSGVRQIEKELYGLATTVIELAIIKGRLDKKIAFYINRLRQAVIKTTGTKTSWSQLSLNELQQMEKQNKKGKASKHKPKKTKSAKVIYEPALGVAGGQVTGTVVKYTHGPRQVIPPQAILVLNSAGPETIPLISQAKGVMFRRGNMMDLGPMVARELGVPALIDHQVEKLESGDKVELDGSLGVWSKHTRKSKPEPFPVKTK